MKNVLVNTPNETISREEAIKLLSREPLESDNNKIFDIYGNYIFPSDITIKEPNTAVGISGICKP